MATDRMYFECAECNDKILIGKQFSYGYYVYNEDFKKKLVDFLFDHRFCMNKKHSPNVYKISYEQD